MSDSGEYYRITCNFCDTILTVVEKQAGTEIKCPDCFTMLKVGPPPEGTKRRNKKRSQSGKSASSGGSDAGEELKLSETFERPAVSPLFGLEASEEDMLAPRKRKPPVDDLESPPEKTATRPKPTSNPERKSPSSAKDAAFAKNKSVPADDSSLSPSELDQDLDVDLPLPVDEVLSLDAIGKLVPSSETEAGASRAQSNQAADEATRPRTKTGKQRVKKQTQTKSSPTEEVGTSRPKFEFANLFMATVTMLTDFRVMVASAAALLVMLIGGFSSEVIFPVGINTESMAVTTSIYKYFASFLFGYLPYYLGLLGLWTIAGVVFQHAAQGHLKVQRWTKGGQGELWSSFLLFGFSFFIAGLPGAIFQLMIIPLRMLVAPMFLISAWFNYSPWQIINTDWYQSVNENKPQWLTVYACFGGLAFAGLLTGGVFMARSYSELVAVDLILTFIGIVSNTVITLVFAAIAGWHTGAVIESLDQDD